MEKRSLQLDFRNKKRLCDQILIELRSQILSGQLQPGERLPTVREVAAQSKVNFNTVARAYRILDQEGWITTRQGRGTFVINKADQDQVDQQQIQNEMIDQLANLMTAAAQRSDLSVSEIVKRVERRLGEMGQIRKKRKSKPKVWSSKRHSPTKQDQKSTKRHYHKATIKKRKV